MRRSTRKKDRRSAKLNDPSPAGQVSIPVVGKIGDDLFDHLLVAAGPFERVLRVQFPHASFGAITTECSRFVDVHRCLRVKIRATSVCWGVRWIAMAARMSPFATIPKYCEPRCVSGRIREPEQ